MRTRRAELNFTLRDTVREGRLSWSGNVRERTFAGKRSRGNVRKTRDGGQNSRVGTFARRDGGHNSREGTFARRDGGENSREGTFARGDLQGHRTGHFQIDCFTVYELAFRLQYVHSFYVPTLT